MQPWENIAKIGTIVAVDSQNRALAKVRIAGRVSDYLPVLHFANSFKRSISPIRVDEQVMVISPHGEANGGFIIRGVFHVGCKEPAGWNSSKEVIEYEDGTRFSYDSGSKKLEVHCVGDISIVAQNITIEALNTNFIGGSVTHNNTAIDDTHTHTQQDGNHFGGGAISTPPNG